MREQISINDYENGTLKKKNHFQIDTAALVIAIYAGLVWSAFSIRIHGQPKEMLIVFPFSFVLSYAILHFFTAKLERITPAVSEATQNNKSVFLFAMIASLAVMMVFYIAFYPGSFSVDSYDQYQQAVSGKYKDWHPVWHTLIFFTLPLKIAGNPSAIVLFQMLWFSLLMGYVASVIAELWNRRAAIWSVAFILLNPFVVSIMLFPWKDVGFAMGAAFCLAYSARLMHRQVKTEKVWKQVLFGFILASTTIFRHNAVLFTVPLLIVLILNVPRSIWIRIVAFSLAAFLLIKIPIYQLLKVEQPGKRVVETTGLQMTIIGNVAKETPEKMDKELADFVYSLASQEQWENDYSCGSFNSIKFMLIDTSPIEEKGYLGVTKLMLKCFAISPGASINAFIALTDTVYGFENGSDGIRAQLGQVTLEGYPAICGDNVRNAIIAWVDFLYHSVFRYCSDIGIVLFAILFLALSRMNMKSWASWKKAFMILPLFAYDFGTMLLLSGFDSRFFFVTFLCAPVLVVFLIDQLKKDRGEKICLQKSL